MWQKRADRAAAAPRSSSSLSESPQAPSKTLQSDPMMCTSGAATSAPVAAPTTSESGMEAATPERVLVEKSVATESQSLEQQLGHREAEFMRGLVSLILEVMQVRQSRPSISRTVSADGPGNLRVARDVTGMKSEASSKHSIF